MKSLRSSGCVLDTSRYFDSHRFGVTYAQPILGDARCNAKQIYWFEILTYTLVEIVQLGVVIRPLKAIWRGLRYEWSTGIWWDIMNVGSKSWKHQKVVTPRYQYLALTLARTLIVIVPLTSVIMEPQTLYGQLSLNKWVHAFNGIKATLSRCETDWTLKWSDRVLVHDDRESDMGFMWQGEMRSPLSWMSCKSFVLNIRCRHGVLNIWGGWHHAIITTLISADLLICRP